MYRNRIIDRADSQYAIKAYMTVSRWFDEFNTVAAGLFHAGGRDVPCYRLSCVVKRVDFLSVAETRTQYEA